MSSTLPRLPAGVKRLPLPTKVWLLCHDGLTAFSKRIDEYGRTHGVTPEEARYLKTWARDFLEHLASVNPTPRAQRAWCEDGARRRERLANQATDAAAARNARAL